MTRSCTFYVHKLIFNHIKHRDKLEKFYLFKSDQSFSTGLDQTCQYLRAAHHTLPLSIRALNELINNLAHQAGL